MFPVTSGKETQKMEGRSLEEPPERRPAQRRTAEVDGSDGAAGRSLHVSAPFPVLFSIIRAGAAVGLLHVSVMRTSRFNEAASAPTNPD